MFKDMNRIKGSKPRTLRKDNTNSILELFKNSEILSASDIIKQINLSKPTIMKILDQLEIDKLIIAQGKGTSSDEGGRKPNLFCLNANHSLSVAFHIFPNEIYAVIADLKCKILKTTFRSIDSQITLPETITHIISCLNELTEGLIQISDLAGIAIGSHGATNNIKGITFYSPHFKNWGNHADFKSLISHELGINIPIFIDNQIRFQILSEKINMSNQETKNLIVIEAGIGLVAGILSKGEVKRGEHFLAGEIGHMIINPGGPQCSCGGFGCFEAMVSTDYIMKKAIAAFDKNKNSSIYLNHNIANLHIFDIFSASNNNDNLACSLIDELAYWFALGLTNLILMHDPQSIIIQGVYSQAGNYFLETLKDQIRSLSPLLKEAQLDIRLSQLGKERSVIGAIWLLAENYYTSYQNN